MTALQYLDGPSDGYRPGACNIGPAEIERRRRTGVAGLAVAGALAIAMLVADAGPLLRLTVAVPLFLGLLGLVQARQRFCVGFALGGLRNFGALGTPSRVEDRAARRTDLRRAVVVVTAVATVSGVIAVLFALLPA